MKSYPFQPEFIFVVVVFILILFVSSYGSSLKVQPFVHTNSKLPQYPYEGFLGKADITPEPINPKVEANPILDAPRSEYLQGYPLNKPEKPYDPISSVLPSSHECIGKASNLSNTTGGICFDNKALELIHTRGGNQTGSK
jgi:hypothetical protein